MDPRNRPETTAAPTSDGDPTRLAELVEALAHESPVARRHHAAVRLADYGPAAVPAVSEAMRRGGRERAVAAYLVWRLDGAQLPAVVATLADVLRSSRDDEARSDATWALGEIGPPAAAAVPALLSTLLRDDDARPWVVSPYAPGPATATLVRVGAATALAAVATPLEPIAESLTRGLASNDASVRWWAASSLAALGPRARGALDDLAAAALNAEELWEVRWQAAHAVASVGGASTAALTALTRLLGDRERWIRVAAARALARVGAVAAAALPELIRALRDPDDHVRRNAVYALAALGGAAAPAVPALDSLIDDPGVDVFAAEALAAIGPAAVPPLGARLGHGDDGVRRLSAHALRLAGTPEATAALAASPVAPLVPAWSLLWPPQKAIDLTDDARRAFGEIVGSALARGENPRLDWPSTHGKPAFMRYLVEDRGLLLHGSNRDDLDPLRPIRWSTDRAEHGNVNGVYATTEPDFAAFFAIVDRAWVWGMGVGSFDESAEDGRSRRSREFSIDAESLVRARWRAGTVYALPRETFEDVGEWTSRVAVRPLLRLPVSPDDFRYLDRVWGFDVRPDARRFERGRFFFLWHAEIYPIIPPRAG